ncbi:MAG: hypothetical protein E6J14_07095 [Chloroflexi bacterium]|nr:MAG: hypothetical protein E6J14_07095 [Chloroflexota bacterium]
MPLREAMELAHHLEICAECDRNKDNVTFLRRCCRLHPWLDGFRRGALPASAHATVRAHLEECRSCRQAVAGSSVDLAGRPQPLSRAIGATIPEPSAAPARRSALVGGAVCAALTAGVLWLTSEATGSSRPTPPPPSPSVTPRAGAALPSSTVVTPSQAASPLPSASLAPAGGAAPVAHARPAAARPPAPAAATAPVAPPPAPARSPSPTPQPTPPPLIPPLPRPPGVMVLR